MTDMFFTVMFTVGLYLGLLAIERRSWILMGAQILCLGYAAEVRPVLGLFAVVNVALLVHLANKNHRLFEARTRNLILASSVCVVIGGNLPALRNYMHFGFFEPTDVLANNMFDYLAHSVLANHGKSDEFGGLQQNVIKEFDIKKTIESKERYAVEVFRSYPLETLAQVGHNGTGILLRGHWTVAANLWGTELRECFY